VSETRRGVTFGVAAYVLWGLSALYWPLMEPTGVAEILALRLVWSAVTLVALVTLLRRWPRVRALVRNPRQVGLLAVAGVLTAANWGLFIYATISGQVVDASLGYFITPLVSVALGVLVLGERLRPWQWAAIVFGAGSVVVLTYDYGGPPWIALGLAATFGTYGLIKKQVALGSAEGLLVETVVLVAPALAYLVVLQVVGAATFGHTSALNTWLGVGSGIVLLLPMLLFGSAATRMPLSLTGTLQYIEPAVQFLIGLLVFREAMSGTRWVGFALLWAALVVLTADGLRARRSALDDQVVRASLP
jgi:chloramphenicol-sensitive protein RarD